MGREDRHTAGADIHRRDTTHQVIREIEVVNHQIEHHGHVGAARLERRQADALEEDGPFEQRLSRTHGTVEALDVPDGEDHALPIRLSQQLIGFGEGDSDRLLHQYRDTVPQAFQADVTVIGRRHCNGNRAHRSQQVGQRFEDAATDLCRHRRSACQIGIIDSDELGAVHRAEMPGVVASEGADSDDAHGESLHHAGTPRCDDETKSRKRATSGRSGRSVRARSRAWPRLKSELKKSR